jgi:hypothetical protein
MSSRGLAGWVVLGLLGGVLGQGCGSSAEPKRPGGSGGTVATAGRDTGMMTVEPPPQGGANGESPYNVLCGIPDQGCVPDVVDACSKVVGAGAGGTGTAGGGMSAGGSRASGGVGGTGGTSAASGGGEGGAPQGGAGADAGVGPAGDGGAPGGQGGESQAGGAGESAGAGAPGAGGEPVPPGVGGSATGGSAGGAGKDPGVMRQPSASCQVRETAKGKPLAECRVAGEGAEGSACFSGSDCEAGLACVGEGPGRCRSYCCGGPAQCPADSDRHCTEQPLSENPPTSRRLMVPVCMPAVKCGLAEPYPCVPPGTCSCPDDSACLIVRDDGLTSCVPESALPNPGDGVEGKACPCAWGFVCSQATDECVKLCQVVDQERACASRRCQASPSLPDGWGTCVGTPTQADGDN